MFRYEVEKGRLQNQTTIPDLSEFILPWYVNARTDDFHTVQKMYFAFAGWEGFETNRSRIRSP